MSPSVLHVERDLKLSVPPGFRMPSLADLGPLRAEPPKRSTTVFYDTADLALAGWGCLLRHRTREGWTVKLPDVGTGEGLERPERSFDGRGAEPPAEAVDVLAAYLRGRSVAPVARMTTIRRRIVMQGADGSALLELVDDRVSTDEGGPRTMRQLEIEPRDASAADLRDRVVSALAGAGAQAGDKRTKYGWVLGNRVPAPEILPPDVDARPSAGAVVLHALATSVVALIRRDAEIRGGRDPESLHQARVIVRRLRSDLRTFKTLLDPDWTEALRAELDWLGEVLGTVRDRQVLATRLGASRERTDDDGVQPVMKILDDEIARAHADLDEAMRGDRYLQLLDALVEAAQKPRLRAPEGAAATLLRPAVDRAWKRLRKAVKTARTAPTTSELHSVRIATKRLRFACEAVESVFGKRARRLARAANELQDVLGEHRDAVVARDWLRDHSAADGAATAFALGELAALELVARDRAEARWPAAWKTLRRRRPTKWS